MKFSRLSENQKEVLDTIISYIKTNGFSPSLREIVERTSIGSLRGVTLQLAALEKMDYITRHDVARGILVDPGLLEETVVKVPLKVSLIPAGSPMDADDYSDATISLNTKQTKGLEENLFAVRVTGDSMIGDNIQEGDIAIFHSQNTAEDGDIVVANVEDAVTLKRFRLVDGIPLLTPANPEYPTIKTEFRVQAKLVNVIKSEEAVYS